eukprot:5529151-Ditylum_brightwellii.AAC.1
MSWLCFHCNLPSWATTNHMNGVMSESICDLANAILQHKDWDPETLHAPNPDFVPTTKVEDEKILFVEGKELIVDIPVDPKGKVDVYINSKVGLAVDIPDTNNALRLERAILQAIHMVARQKCEGEKIPREQMTCLAKLLAEAGLEERNNPWLVLQFSKNDDCLTRKQIQGLV